MKSLPTKKLSMLFRLRMKPAIKLKLPNWDIANLNRFMISLRKSLKNWNCIWTYRSFLVEKYLGLLINLRNLSFRGKNNWIRYLFFYSSISMISLPRINSTTLMSSRSITCLKLKSCRRISSNKIQGKLICRFALIDTPWLKMPYSTMWGSET